MNRIFVFSALVAAGLAALPAAAERAPEEALVSAHSLAGAFLAAETARAENDFDAAVRYYTDALSFDPDNAAIQQELLIALVTNGQFDEALPLAEKLKKDPQIERVSRLVLGIDAIRARRYMQADSALILAIETDLERLLTGVMRAWAQFGAGETDNALALLDGLDGPDWYGLFVSYHGALIADAAGRKAEAAERYDNAVNDTTGASASPQTYLRLAESYAGFLARNGDTDAAREIIARALAIAPANPPLLALADAGDKLAAKALKIADPAAGASEILLNIGSAINRDGAEGFAALYLEMARVLAPGNAQIQFELGGIAERLGDPQRAIDFYDRIPDTSPLGRLAHLQKGLNLADMDRNEEAKEILAAAIEEDPGEYRGYLALGGVHASLKEYEEAAALYERAIANIDTNEPMYWPLYYRMGIAYERTKQWDKAEAAFKRALELSPDQPDVLNYLGYSWIDMNINLEEGLDMIRKAVEMRPRDGYIVDSLGWAYYRLGRFEDAVAELEKATDLRPTDAIIIDHLGDAYWRVGRRLEATYQWAQALDMEIEPEEAARIKAKLAASNTPGMEPEIAVSQVDDGADSKTAASPDDADGG
ncbi:tetratricopeptide repeat protein [Oricola thermophila]|uniref:Tetratricopeptide repeat protein n=1 Tax=Oricola thermophila TaxID=2742145 RepID=A0A6N1VE04_9HYPH|nr:tetratricopeptide repeat protein [Oricola thermophila]QKV18928.1 tetratricopeptide repeat protein [Oricola thermophila]